MTVYVKHAGSVPVSRELLDDAAPFRRTVTRLLENGLKDTIFSVAVGRSRWNPNPMPAIRLIGRLRK